MATYTSTGTNWFDVSTGTSGGEPGAGDTLFFRPGITNNVLLNPESSIGGPYANIFISPGAAVDLGTGSAIDGLSYDNFTVGNVFVWAGASLSLMGSIEGDPAAETMYANNVFLAPGSTLNFGDAQAVDGPGTINNLFNNGGSLLVPYDAFTALSMDNVQIGGPGFVQVGIFTPTESEYNDGAGHTVINLGNIVEGTGGNTANGDAAYVDLSIRNATSSVQTGILSVLADNGFSTFDLGQTSIQPDSTEPVTKVADLLSSLGAHSIVLGFNGPNVHDTLVITDKVVAA